MDLYEELAKLDLLDEAGVLNIAQRKKRALTMRRFKNKMKIHRKRQAKRIATRERVGKRSRRAAIRVLRKRLAGQKRGGSYADLSSAEKMVIDKRVRQRQGLVTKLAKRLMPKVRKQEHARLKSSHKRKTNEAFEREELTMITFGDERSLLEVVDVFLNRIEGPPQISEKAYKNLVRKSEQSGVPLDEIIDVYTSGLREFDLTRTPEQAAFGKVNLYLEYDKSHSERVNSKQKKEMNAIRIRHARQDAAAKERDLTREMNANFEMEMMIYDSEGHE